MSTRASICVQAECCGELEQQWFYRHSDGYPEPPHGVLPDLKKFLLWTREGKIRRNVEKASGWLVRIGADQSRPEPTQDVSGWKASHYEPCPHDQPHGDVEYIYIVDLDKMEIQVHEAGIQVPDWYEEDTRFRQKIQAEDLPDRLLD